MGSDAGDAAPAKAKKKQPKPTHPQYAVMIVAAIKALKERKGSSKRTILKYIQKNYKVGDQASSRLNIALRKLGKSGKLKQVKGVGARGSFKIPKKEKPAGPKKPRGRPKGAGAKKKPAAKKGKRQPRNPQQRRLPRNQQQRSLLQLVLKSPVDVP